MSLINIISVSHVHSIARQAYSLSIIFCLVASPPLPGTHRFLKTHVTILNMKCRDEKRNFELKEELVSYTRS